MLESKQPTFASLPYWLEREIENPFSVSMTDDDDRNGDYCVFDATYIAEFFAESGSQNASPRDFQIFKFKRKRNVVSALLCGSFYLVE
jgi:hypothetical protein